MARAQIICFRATKSIHEMINRIMDERMIDRTTVIKMALYHFDSYMRDSNKKNKTLYDIVSDLEDAASPEQVCFEEFSLSETRSAALACLTKKANLDNFSICIA